jgi:tetratricopeptide (TPR) repeat protein
MDQLGLNNFSECLSLLKNGEKILISEDQVIPTAKRNKLLSLTLNNLGCYYKKMEKPNVALQYLKHSLDIEVSLAERDSLNLAGTYLNLCSIYSKLSKHADAVMNAQLAIDLLEAIIKEEADKTFSAGTLSKVLV